MDGSLFDAEGYPRSDIDLYAVRTARNRVICGSHLNTSAITGLKLLTSTTIRFKKRSQDAAASHRKEAI